MDVEREFMQSLVVGLVIVMEEVEMVGGRAEGVRMEEEVMEATGETTVVM